MIQFFSKPFRWAIIYSALLIAFSAYALLDAFVIPRAIQPAASQAPGAATVTPAATTAASPPENSGPPVTTGEGAVYTASSYKDANISITITTERHYDTQVYIADIRLESAAYFQTAFARDIFGYNVIQTTSDIARAHHAILAVNGDFYGFRKRGFVIRDGILYRDTPRRNSDDEALVVYGDGSFEVVKENDVEAADLLARGAVQVFSFGPSLLTGGEVSINEDSTAAKAQTSHPRTAIGIVSPLHYIMIVADGRTDASVGLTLDQLARIFQARGCETAYNFDGGGSTTMWFNGKVINIPTDGMTLGERRVSDIVYIGY